jgi:anthranilate synthase/aminodeoxychorismate synthase-like glutamine amidotransferase
VILLIDNYDSFTFNLYQLLRSLAGEASELKVIRNDAISGTELKQLAPERVVLSPGPGHPADSGLSLLAPDLFPATPLLGVCLGHQALALACGAQIGRAPHPTHGRPIPIEHSGKSGFEGIPSPMHGALYHSLVVQEPHLPECLAVTARSPAGDIMALHHRERPHLGVQFHPESFMTNDGPSLIQNFLESP